MIPRASHESRVLAAAAGTEWGAGSVSSSPLHPRPSRRERRNPAARLALERRFLGEFQEMPGLRLTVRQAVRLFGVPRTITERILAELARSGWLERTPDGQYVYGLER